MTTTDGPNHLAEQADGVLSVDNLPVLLEPEQWIEWFQDNVVTPAAVGEAVTSVGRDKAPWLLSRLWGLGSLDGPTLTRFVGGLWSMAEYPDALLDHDVWRLMFEAAGYTVNGQPAARPAEAMTLWRGSVPERRSDWSWTDSQDIARGYAEGTRARRLPGLLWVATVEPWRLLARNHEPDDGRAEHEYVVDTDGLAIRPA